MSLDYDLGAIPNYEEECFIEVESEDGEMEKRLHPTCETMIWSSLSLQCNFSQIDELQYRVRMLKAIDFELATKNGQSWYPPEEDLKKFSKLRTNVIHLNRAKWHKWLIRIIENRARDIKRMEERQNVK